MVFLLCVLIQLTVAQQLISFTGDQFNVTLTTHINNFLSYNFNSVDLPGVIYTLKLTQIYEGGMSNGRVALSGQPIPLNGLATISTKKNTASINMTYTFNTNKYRVMTGFRQITITNAFWFKNSTKNVCPDINAGRFCVKTTIFYSYHQNPMNKNPYLIFVWELLANTIVSTTMNVATTNTQVINNLGFLSIENSAIVLNSQTGIQQTLPVAVELRRDNLPTNGIWVIYQLGTAMVVHTTHDPVFGVNQPGTTLTADMVILALSVSTGIVFLMILCCSIYIYLGTTKSYYLNLRGPEETDEIQSEELFTE
jgi:hypothetical protein